MTSDELARFMERINSVAQSLENISQTVKDGLERVDREILQEFKNDDPDLKPFGIREIELQKVTFQCITDELDRSAKTIRWHGNRLEDVLCILNGLPTVDRGPLHIAIPDIPLWDESQCTHKGTGTIN